MVPDCRVRAVTVGLAALILAVAISAGLAIRDAAGAATTAQRQSDEVRPAYLTSQFDYAKTVAPRRGESARLTAASPRVTAVAFSPDGTLLASAYSDGVIRMWNPATGHQSGQVLQAAAGRRASATTVAFSPDGKLLAGAYSDGVIRLWNPATGQPVRAPLTAGRGVNAIAFSPDSRLLASAGTDGTIRLWNPATGRLARPALPAGGGVNAIAFSPDGKLLASADTDGTIRLWNPVTGRPGGPVIPASAGGRASATAVAFSPGGALLAGRLQRRRRPPVEPRGLLARPAWRCPRGAA